MYVWTICGRCICVRSCSRIVCVCVGDAPKSKLCFYLHKTLCKSPGGQFFYCCAIVPFVRLLAQGLTQLLKPASGNMFPAACGRGPKEAIHWQQDAWCAQHDTLSFSATCKMVECTLFSSVC